MKKLFRVLILLVVFCTFVNAGQYIDKNGRIYWIDEKPFIFNCIDGYKWVQFIEKGGGVGRGDLYFPSGNPQQMFEKRNDKSVPVECDK